MYICRTVPPPPFVVSLRRNRLNHFFLGPPKFYQKAFTNFSISERQMDPRIKDEKQTDADVDADTMTSLFLTY